GYTTWWLWLEEAQLTVICLAVSARIYGHVIPGRIFRQATNWVGRCRVSNQQPLPCWLTVAGDESQGTSLPRRARGGRFCWGRYRNHSRGRFRAASERNTKHQAPEKFQISNTKLQKQMPRQTARRTVFELGAWCFFGAWRFGNWKLLAG